MRDLPCQWWFPCSARLTPVNAFQKHRQLRTRQRHGSALSLRPYEAATLQALLEKAKAIAIEPEQLDHVAALAAEDENMAGIALLFQHCLDQRTQPLKAATQIREPSGNP